MAEVTWWITRITVPVHELDIICEKIIVHAYLGCVFWHLMEKQSDLFFGIPDEEGAPI